MLQCQYRPLKKKWDYTTRQHLPKGLQKEVQQKGDTNQEIKALSYSQPANVKCLMVPLSLPPRPRKIWFNLGWSRYGRDSTESLAYLV